MDYRFLGRTGLKISAITLGAQTFGWSVAEEDAFKLLDHYLAAGGNYLDAADSYNQGRSEEIVGRWVKARGVRARVLLGTKVFFPTGPGPNDQGGSRHHLVEAVEGSLRRLQTDHLDLEQLHCFDRMTPLDETLRALDDLVRAGKVRYLGASNFAPSHLQKALMLSQMRGWAGLASLQLEYSLLVRSPEWELLPQCREEGVGTLAWSPLAVVLPLFMSATCCSRAATLSSAALAWSWAATCAEMAASLALGWQETNVTASAAATRESIAERGRTMAAPWG